MQYRQSGSYMHQGLWRYCVPGKCMTHTDSIGETSWTQNTVYTLENCQLKKNQLISGSIWTAYWDATRAFMILSILACFFGIIIGVVAFINYSSFNGFDKTFAAGILYFISCKNVNASNTKNNINKLNYSYISKLTVCEVIVYLRCKFQASLCCWLWLSTLGWQSTTMENDMGTGGSRGRT